MKIFLSTLFLILLPMSSVSAAVFSDVQPNDLYAKAIYDLQKKGVINGNPDGTFAPKRELNRAEFLTLLYRAADKETRPVFSGCKPDVPADAWFSEVVCTAIQENIVQGYPDGTFKPEQSVNRVEALKIILNTLGFTIPPLSQGDLLSLDFLQVTHGSWYAPFLHRALALDMIPQEMMEKNMFDPGAPLLRGEAAEILSRALATYDEIESEGTVLPTGAILKYLPFHETGKTGERGAVAFAFDIRERDAVIVRASNLTEGFAPVSCFLYLLSDSGFSSQFWVGYQEGATCEIHADITPGRYQVEVRTQEQGDEFAVDVTDEGTSDGNDGFISARNLSVSTPLSGSLEPQDLEDWFRFTVRTQGRYMLTLGGDAGLGCTIYPDADVDLFGEDAPQCNAEFSFTPGTYYVSIQRIPPKEAQYAYIIELKE